MALVNFFKISQVLIGPALRSCDLGLKLIATTRSFAFVAKIYFVFKVILSLSMALNEP